MSVNKVILVGRLGREPELRYTPSGAAVCNFSIATGESWVDKSGQKQEKTEWHRIVVWSKLAEVCNQYLAKGRQVYLEGQLQTRSWEDSDTKQKRYTTEIVAKTVQFLGGASQGAGANSDRSVEPSQERKEFQGNNGGGADIGGGSAMDRDYTVSNDANFTADDIPF